MKSTLYQSNILSLNIKCQQHKFNESEFVYLKPDAKNVFICSRCVTESNGTVQLSDCVELKQIQDANSDTILSKYPPLSSPELNQKVLLFSSSVEGEIEQVKEYYQKLIKSYETAVKKAMQKSKAEIDNLQRLRESFIKNYAKVAQIDNLKQLIIQSQKDSSDAKLRSFINNKSKEADKNANIISTQLQELQEYKELFSAEQPEKQITNILQEIEKISFFNKATKATEAPQNPIIPQQNNQTRSTIASSMIKTTKADNSGPFETIENQNHFENTNIGLLRLIFKTSFQSKTNYIIIIKTIVRDRLQPNPAFFFGLLDVEKSKSFYYNEIDENHSISKMIKGKRLHLGSDISTNLQNYWRWNGERRFEVRFNQENRILKVGSLPGYSLVAEIQNKTDIDLFTRYTFEMGCTGRGNKIVLEDVLEVDSFNDSMDNKKSLFQNCFSSIFKKKVAFQL